MLKNIVATLTVLSHREAFTFLGYVATPSWTHPIREPVWGFLTQYFLYFLFPISYFLFLIS